MDKSTWQIGKTTEWVDKKTEKIDLKIFFTPIPLCRILRKHMKHQVFIIILYSNTYAYKQDIVFEKEDHKVIPIKCPLTEL